MTTISTGRTNCLIYAGGGALNDYLLRLHGHHAVRRAVHPAGRGGELGPNRGAVPSQLLADCLSARRGRTPRPGGLARRGTTRRPLLRRWCENRFTHAESASRGAHDAANASNRRGRQEHRNANVHVRRHAVGARRWLGRDRDNYAAPALRHGRPHHGLIHAGGVR